MRLINADKYMERLQLAINADADTIAEYIKRDTPIGTVKDGGRIGRLQGLQWCKNVLELDYYTVEAIPKDQYEAKLKADMVAMLEDLDLKIDEMYELQFSKEGMDGFYWAQGLFKALVQQKIDKLKENEDDR